MEPDTLNGAGSMAPRERLASPLVDDLRRAIERAHRSELGPIISELYRLNGAGHLDEADLESLDTLARARQRLPPPPSAPKLPRPRRLRGETSPRRLGQQAAAHKANLPDHVARGFADCAKGVLGVIARACGPGGACTLLMGQIANKVGCSIESVRLTLREAERRKLIKTVHRRRSARQNAPNLVTIADEGWRAWIAIGLKGAAKRAGAELRTRAQAARDAFRRRKDDRAAAATLRAERGAPFLRGEARVESLRGAAEARAARAGNEQTPKPFGATPESSFQEESPSVASQLQEKNCPNGSSANGGGLFEAARRAAHKLGLNPIHGGKPPKMGAGETSGTILDGVAYRWT